MNLSLWKRSDPISGNLARLRDEMDRTFDRFFSQPWGVLEPKDLPGGEWLPALDVSESDAEVTVSAEVPGIAAKDVEVTVAGRTLTISGHKEQEEETKRKNFYRCERSFGSFRRVVELPDTVDAEKVTAESNNGVVTVHIAKKPGAKPKTIEVKPAAKKVAVGAG